MTITAADIKILASERMRDTADGGGHATAIALESGAENNMFPDVSDADRVWGYLRLRKVYPSIVNAGTDTLLGAYAYLEDMPDDPDTTAWIMGAAGIAEEREAAISLLLDNSHWVVRYVHTWEIDFSNRHKLTGSPAPKIGQVINAMAGTSGDVARALIVDVVDLGGGAYECAFDWWPISASDAGVPAGLTHACAVAPDFSFVHSTIPVSGTLTAGATTAACSRPLHVAVVPKHPGVHTIGAPDQIGLGDRSVTGPKPAGVVPCVHPGDILVVHHTADTAPTTVIAGSVIACGRTAIASARVFGASGAEITTGFTVDLAAGTVTVSNPSGWSQPVTVRHRIEDVLGCSSLDYDDPRLVIFNRPLARDFPAGTLLSSALPLGEMQALVASVFSQSLWTASWQNTRIGSPIAAQYDDVGHPIAVTNRDAITERWAVEFLTSTTFRLFGEQLGEIATGSVNADLAPLNPATGHPYFTVAATGWGNGWSGGNVLRWNTIGASVPLWAARVVLPSAPGAGGDALTLAIKGNIDA